MEGWGKPTTTGSSTYATQGAATAAIQAVFYRHPLLEPIDGDDRLFLRELLARHLRAEEKIGVGVKHFTFELAKGGKRAPSTSPGSMTCGWTSHS